MAYLGSMIGRLLGGVITVIMIGVAISLAISNPDDILIKLWPLDHQLTIPTWLVVLASFGAGLILGGLAMVTSLFGMKMKQFNLNKSIKKLEKEKLELSNKLSESMNADSQNSLLGVDHKSPDNTNR